MLLGVEGRGHCLCGPYLPLSLVRLGPDTLIPHPNNGYNSQHPIIRFSHTHVSGTGGGGRYGNIGSTPFIGEPRTSPDTYSQEDEAAEAGYYMVRLLPAAVKAELTMTPHVGVHRYTFPKESEARFQIIRSLCLLSAALLLTSHVAIALADALRVGARASFSTLHWLPSKLVARLVLGGSE